MSTDTPTPFTDAEEEFATNVPDSLGVVSADFARTLERENAELRGKLERLASQFEKRPDGYIPARELRAILNEEASK